MSDTETRWYLCNTKTQTQLNSMSWNDARNHCMTIPEEEGIYWNVWQESWPGWKPIAEVSELHSLLKKKKVEPPKAIALPPPIPKVPPMPAAPKVAPAPVAAAPAVIVTPPPKAAAHHAPDLVPPLAEAPKAAHASLPIVANVSRNNKRKHQRFEMRLRVIIRNEQLTFRTFSKDISLGGISLENAVPEHLFETGCHIFIAGPDGNENLRFDLGPTSRNDLRYFSFSTLEQKFLQKLAGWLEKNGRAKGVA